MAVRYSGDLVVRLHWDGTGYVGSVSNGRRRWRGSVKVLWLPNPESPRALDRGAEGLIRASGMGGAEYGSYGRLHVGREFECPCPGHVPPRKRGKR